MKLTTLSKVISQAQYAQYGWLVESPAPGIILRQSVFEPLQTGLISIDSMIPIAKQPTRKFKLVLYLFDL